MHNPPHPGEILRSLCLEPLGITVSQAAGALGVSRKTLSAIHFIASLEMNLARLIEPAHHLQLNRLELAR